MPDTCTYESYVGGIGCKFQIDDPITATKLQVGVDKCPGSYLPYVSVSCKGPYCPYFGKPCGGINDCGGGTNSLVCRSVEPGQGLPDQVRATLVLCCLTALQADSTVAEMLTCPHCRLSKPCKT